MHSIFIMFGCYTFIRYSKVLLPCLDHSWTKMFIRYVKHLFAQKSLERIYYNSITWLITGRSVSRILHMDKKVFWYIHVFLSLYLSEVFERQGPLFSLQSEASIASRCFFIEIASFKVLSKKSLYTSVFLCNWVTFIPKSLKTSWKWKIRKSPQGPTNLTCNGNFFALLQF